MNLNTVQLEIRQSFQCYRATHRQGINLALKTQPWRSSSVHLHTSGWTFLTAISEMGHLRIIRHISLTLTNTNGHLTAVAWRRPFQLSRRRSKTLHSLVNTCQLLLVLSTPAW